MVGLSIKEISSSQLIDVQNDTLNKHKSAQQFVIKKENIFPKISVLLMWPQRRLVFYYR
jgi:hypothetical protein